MSDSQRGRLRLAAANHEAAHIVVASDLGYTAVYAEIRADGSGRSNSLPSDPPAHTHKA